MNYTVSADRIATTPGKFPRRSASPSICLTGKHLSKFVLTQSLLEETNWNRYSPTSRAEIGS